MKNKEEKKVYELVVNERLKNGQLTGKQVTVTTDNPADLWGFLYKHTPANMRNTLTQSYLEDK